MEVPFDPEEQCQKGFEAQDKEAKAKVKDALKFQLEVATLERCPQCKKEADWKPVSGGLRCRRCGAYVGMTDQNRGAMVRIGMLRQCDVAHPEKEDDEDD